VQSTRHEGVIPIELANELQDLVDCLLGQDIVDQMAYEEFLGSALPFLAGSTLGRVALFEFVSKNQDYTADSPDSTHSQGGGVVFDQNAACFAYVS
jgi:hypothetical protein